MDDLSNNGNSGSWYHAAAIDTIYQENSGTTIPPGSGPYTLLAEGDLWEFSGNWYTWKAGRVYPADLIFGNRYCVWGGAVGHGADQFSNRASVASTMRLDVEIEHQTAGELGERLYSHDDGFYDGTGGIIHSVSEYGESLIAIGNQTIPLPARGNIDGRIEELKIAYVVGALHKRDESPITDDRADVVPKYIYAGIKDYGLGFEDFVPNSAAFQTIVTSGENVEDDTTIVPMAGSPFGATWSGDYTHFAGKFRIFVRIDQLTNWEYGEVRLRVNAVHGENSEVDNSVMPDGWHDMGEFVIPAGEGASTTMDSDGIKQTEFGLVSICYDNGGSGTPQFRLREIFFLPADRWVKIPTPIMAVNVRGFGFPAQTGEIIENRSLKVVTPPTRNTVIAKTFIEGKVIQAGDDDYFDWGTYAINTSVDRNWLYPKDGGVFILFAPLTDADGEFTHRFDVWLKYRESNEVFT